jgi:sugar phosphate permease
MSNKSNPPDRPVAGGLDVELGLADSAGAENLQRLRSKLSIQDQTSRLPMKQLLVIFFGLAISLLLSFLDQTSVSTALPSMAREFGAASEVSWVGTSFLIANTSMQVLYGRLSDVFGRKGVLISALAIFACGNLLCGFAQSMVYSEMMRLM